MSAERIAPWCAMLALCVATLVLCGACASKKPPPKPPTEDEVRQHWTKEESDRAIDKVTDPELRRSLHRYFADRTRDASGRHLKLAVESVLIGENIDIGGGLSDTRLFALYHEFDDTHFVSYLGAFEAIGGRLNAEFHRPVGGTKVGIARLDFAELNRAIIKLYIFAPGDPPCCPSRSGETGYQLNASGLDVLE